MSMEYRPRPDASSWVSQPPSLAGPARSVSPTRAGHQPTMSSSFHARQPSPPRHHRPPSPPAGQQHPAFNPHTPFSSHNPHKSTPAFLPSVPSQQHNIPRPRSTPATPALPQPQQYPTQEYYPSRPLSSLALSPDMTNYPIPVTPSPSLMPPPSPVPPSHPPLTHITHSTPSNFTSASSTQPLLAPATPTGASTSTMAAPTTPSLLQLSSSSKISDSVEKLRERALEVDRILKSLPRFRVETPTPE